MSDFDSIVDGRPVSTDRTFTVFDPSTGASLGEAARCGAAEIDAAVASSRRAYDSVWSTMSVRDRSRIVRRMAVVIEREADSLALLESQDTGKPLGQAMADVLIAARYFEFYGGIVEGATGRYINTSPDLSIYTVEEPHGVCGHIVPWNYPIQVSARTIAPALAAGNCCVLKPAEEAPLTALRLGELALEAGFPPGVLNVVAGMGDEAGAALAGHPGIDFLSFTGSVQVGRLVAKAAAENIVPVALELGGKSPNIVFADADLSVCVPVIANSILQNAGQTCSAGARLLVEGAVHVEIVDRLKEHFSKVVIGPGPDNPDLGPLISQKQLDRVRGFIDSGSAVSSLVCGGGSPEATKHLGGYYFEPTIFDNVPYDAPLAQEEVFGPVLSVIEFTDAREAARIANSTPYGLISAVWTHDLDRAHWLAGQIHAGQVYVNTYGVGGGVEMPFGGYGHSGYGREKGVEGLAAYVRSKTVAVRIAAPPA